MNGKCAKRIRGAYRNCQSAGADITYKALKREYKALPYCKRFPALQAAIGKVPASWHGSVPGHSLQIKARISRAHAPRKTGGIFA